MTNNRASRIPPGAASPRASTENTHKRGAQPKGVKPMPTTPPVGPGAASPKADGSR